MTRTADDMIIASDRHGQYAARTAAEVITALVDSHGWRYQDNDDALAMVEFAALDPATDFYWDDWNMLENTVRVRDPRGNAYQIHMDGDVFLVDLNLPESEWNERFGM